MMAADSPVAVDVEHLQRTLSQLGYQDKLSAEAAPLVHRILIDYSTLSSQYEELGKLYDELFAQWKKSEQTSTPVAKKGGEYSALDLTHLSGLDSSVLLELGVPSATDTSFMLQAVEQARSRVDALMAQVEELTLANKKLGEDKSALVADLQKSQCAAQELSQLLHAKHGHLDALQGELDGLKRKNDLGFLIQLNTLVKSLISLLPTSLQDSFLVKISDSDSFDSLLSLAMETIHRLKREDQTLGERLVEAQEKLEVLNREKLAGEEALAKMKSGVSQYQSQVAELNHRLYQKEFDKSLQADLKSQMIALEGVNNTIREKLAVLDRLKHDASLAPSTAEEMSQLTVHAMLESLMAELHTEVGFCSHLNKMVEKLNSRKIEQDRELQQLGEKLYDAEAKLAKSEAEKAEIKAQVDRLSTDFARKEGAFNTTSEVIHNLRQALEAKQVKIDEQKSKTITLF